MRPRTETSEARLLLKQQIQMQDAIFNCGRVAVLARLSFHSSVSE